VLARRCTPQLKLEETRDTPAAEPEPAGVELEREGALQLLGQDPPST
jgi:hypothetical protein